MPTDALSIGELADAAGLSRRAIRFYVQQKLLPPPTGLGRGSHYEQRHLDQLRKVIELQQAGHSLVAIRKMLDRDDARASRKSREHANIESENGHATDARASAAAMKPAPAALSAELLSARLWTRLSMGDGIELSFDATRFNPTVEQLLTLRQLIRDTLRETP